MFQRTHACEQELAVPDKPSSRQPQPASLHCKATERVVRHGCLASARPRRAPWRLARATPSLECQRDGALRRARPQTPAACIIH